MGATVLFALVGCFTYANFYLAADPFRLNSAQLGSIFFVYLLGVVITMIAAQSVNEPNPRQQRITMALLPAPAALAITAGVLLAPHRVASDIVFVVDVFAAVYARRFGARGRPLR